jgi:hypothetical protein
VYPLIKGRYHKQSRFALSAVLFLIRRKQSFQNKKEILCAFLEIQQKQAREQSFLSKNPKILSF